MLDIEETNLNVKMLKSKSLRDAIISDKIPSPPLCQNSACYYIVGACGLGKTFLIESLMRKTFKRMFDAVFLVAPTTSRSSYADSYCKSMNPIRIYDTLTVENLNTILNEVNEINSQGGGKEARFSALIIDDCTSDLRVKAVNKLLIKTIANHRHINLSIFILSQFTQALHLTIRSLMTILIQFKTGSLKERSLIHSEFLPEYKLTEVDDILNYIYSEKYHFLLVNRRLGIVCNSFNPLTITRGD